MTTEINPRGKWTSASSAAADALCPGRHQAQAGIPESKSDDAAGGQAIHDALKAGDPSKLTLDQSDVYDSCKSIEQKLVTSFFGEKATVVSFREQRYWCNVIALGADNEALSQYQHSGQADVVYRSGTKALVIDYKTLQGDVEDSPKNLQLRDLACLVKGHFVLLDEIATVIIQPLVTHSPELCLYDVPDLKRAETEMFARVVASNAPGAPRKAGELQCKFCLAKSKCAQYSQWVGALIPTGTMEPLVKHLVFQTAMELWTPSDCAVAASLLSPAGKALDEIKEFLKARLKADINSIPGWGLTAPGTREVINDPQACFDRFAALGGQLDKFMKGVSISKTKLKEAVHEVTGAKGMALDQQVKKLIEGIVEISPTQPSLKKVSDK